jgi:UDP-N-acetylglucosamine--N-acetylmuramyl-(pentapeptide) pyrophosphoryl-undecaprenol N-acetylglucosamine transferase
MTDDPAPLILLAAGGTGGHVFPAEALASELQSRGVRLALVTDRRGGAFGGTLGGLETHRISAGGFAGKGLVGKLAGLRDVTFGLFQARALVKRLAPRVVVGFGGYASLPTVLAAGLLSIPTAIHEQNAVLGRANRVLARRVAKLASSYPKVAHLPASVGSRLIFTGMPVRPAFARARGALYRAPEADGPIRLLILGGSQGAQVFGELLPGALALLPQGLRARLDVSQQCRPEQLDTVRQSYRDIGVTANLASFFDDVCDRLVAAHLVICRSGASTVAELTAVGRPAILVPYPHAIDDHQAANAAAVAEAGGGWMMRQQALSEAIFAERLQSLLMQPASLLEAAMRSRAFGRPDAAARLADAVLALAGWNGAGATLSAGGPLGRQAA